MTHEIGAYEAACIAAARTPNIQEREEREARDAFIPWGSRTPEGGCCYYGTVYGACDHSEAAYWEAEAEAADAAVTP